MNNSNNIRKVGDVYRDGNTDPNTGEPYYYRVVKMDDDYIASIRCHPDGKDYVKTVPTSPTT